MPIGCAFLNPFGYQASCRTRFAHRIDDLEFDKILFVISDRHAIIRTSDGGDDHIESIAARPEGLLSAIRWAQTKPALSSNGSMRPANSACGPSGPGEPRVERIALLAARLFQESRDEFPPPSAR